MKYQAFGIILALLCVFALCSCKDKEQKEQPAETSGEEIPETSAASLSRETEAVTEPVKAAAEYEFTYEIEDGEVKILGYKGYDKRVVIPDEIFGCPVTKINARAFADTDVEELTLPETLTGFKGIKSAGKLKVLNLPGGLELEDLGGNMLGMSSLADVNIKEGGAFTSDGGIVYTDGGKTLVYFPQGRTGAFTVPEGVEAIESHAFRYSAITEVTLPKTLKSIGNGAFSESGITELDIPPSVTEIGGRILGGDRELCISAEESGDHTANLDYYNVTYRNDGVLKQAFRAANEFECDKIFIDLNFDSFPEMIYELPGEGWMVAVYDTGEEAWLDSDFRYFRESRLTGADLELYYDREKDMYFYASCDRVYDHGNYTARKHYVCKNGFCSFLFGEERMYYGDEGGIFFVDHVGGEFACGQYNSETPAGADSIGTAGNAFLGAMDRALEKYEHIVTVDMHSLITRASESPDGIAFAQEGFADEPSESGLQKSAPDTAEDEFCGYVRGDISDNLPEKPNITLYNIYGGSDKPAELTGIEGLQGVKELFIETEVTDIRPITALQSVEILHISDKSSDLSFIAEMKNLKVLEIYNAGEETEDFFAPIYGCGNIEYLLCAKSGINEGQLKALKENMPRLEIFIYS